mmetsp:Transcript_26623/g.47887  ORF Transcript_26623/g.47887 Transcript_26623/m.47887 type:complete len:218 (+) Transcript_26623:1594-2247(+)
MLLLILQAAVVVSMQAYCPNMVCSSMPSRLCAFAAGNLVYANNEGCGEGICSLDYMLVWFYNTTNAGYFLECMPVTTKVELLEVTNSSCYTVQSDQELKDSIWPKECDDENDCELESGELASCECGLDGNKYCKPPITSKVFMEFWESCDALTQTTSVNTRIMWDWSYKFYTYILSGADCSSNLFYELDIEYLFDYVYDSSSALELGVLLTALSLIE